MKAKNSMNVTYTGKHQEFSDLQKKKLETRIAKVGKLVDGKNEKKAEKGLHVFFTTQRHLTKVEATLNYYGYSAVGASSDADAFKALMEALTKLEKQVVKVRDKWIDSKKRAAPLKAALAPKSTVEDIVPTQIVINRVHVSQRRKPITAEEALLVIGKKDPYLAFRDFETGSVSVLIRKIDGSFDLIET